VLGVTCDGLVSLKGFQGSVNLTPSRLTLLKPELIADRTEPSGWEEGTLSAVFNYPLQKFSIVADVSLNFGS